THPLNNKCTSVTSGPGHGPKNASEQGNGSLCLRQIWSGWNTKPFINNYSLMIINMEKVKGGH
ncbi:hypothetical protein ACQP3C_28335, partial [Escherichia coli]